MFGNTWLKTPDKPYSESVRELREALNSCDAVVIGAGSGLSAAAGYRYSGELFERYFWDFQSKYGIRDMYSGGFYPFPDIETFWAWWGRHIWVNRYSPIPSDLYEKLFALVKGRDYFVLTTNVDHCFQRAGFDKKRLFYTQGDYGLFQSVSPHGASKKKTYDNEEMVRKMVLSQGFEISGNGELIVSDRGRIRMSVDKDLIPVCPDDGCAMVPNLRSDDTFVEDAGWHEAAASYGDFLALHGIEAYGFFTEDSTEKVSRSYRGKVLFLELGVGANTPGIIKYPFWQYTAENENALYACLNMGDAAAPKEISDRSILIDGDIAQAVADLQ